VATYPRHRSEDAPRRDLHRPYARRLGGERGEAIVRSMPRQARQRLADHRAHRGDGPDRQALRARRREGRCFNLAAGLDSRAFRLDLPRDLRWIHADLPPMVEYFRERMADSPAMRLEYAALDLRDEGPRRALFESAAAPARCW
jgi:O-methyltransferase involved in polyketide biosynthesis